MTLTEVTNKFCQSDRSIMLKQPKFFETCVLDSFNGPRFATVSEIHVLVDLGALADRFFDMHYITYSQVLGPECALQMRTVNA